MVRASERSSFRLAVRGGVAAALVLLSACSSDEEPYVERPVEELYNTAMDAMEEREFATAAKAFEEVERQHPYSKWATKAELMAAYAYYLLNQYDNALVALDRYIQLHPASVETPYAYYLKALCYYEQISDVARDQKMTQLARQTLEELTTRFPDSRFARDAAVKIDLTYDHLAGKTMEIGRYYLRQAQYLAAINRFRIVVDRFQTTTHVPEALHRLVEAYVALGMAEEAHKAAAVLGHNYPGSEWYIDSYELVENTTVRPKDRAWYNFWSSDEKKVADTDLPPIEKDRGPWYDFFGSGKPDKPAKEPEIEIKKERSFMRLW